MAAPAAKQPVPAVRPQVKVVEKEVIKEVEKVVEKIVRVHNPADLTPEEQAQKREPKI